MKIGGAAGAKHVPRAGSANLPDVVEAIGTDGFAPRLVALLHEICGADHCAVFEFGEDSLREVAAENVDQSYEAREYVSRYLDQQYWRRDPAIAEVQKRLLEQDLVVHRVDIAALDRELRGAIFPYVSDRIVICGRRQDATFGVSIIRSNPHPLFSDDAIVCLTDLADLLVSVLAKHADVIFHRPNLALALTSLPDVERCIAAKAALTRRETEVCARILYGLSSMGVALDLGISQESVKTYRKRAYDRLGIGSERELLKWYLAMWDAFQRELHPGALSSAPRAPAHSPASGRGSSNPPR